MNKIDKTVKRESAYIAVCVIIGSVIMQLIFLAVGKWDLTVITGNILGASAAILNFFLMGLTVQNAITKEKKQASSAMRVSRSLRMLMLFAAAAVGILSAYFNTVCTVLPLFFPRIAVFFRPLFNKKIKEL